MSERPAVRRTYGKSTRPPNSSSILFSSTPIASSSRTAPLEDSESPLWPGVCSSSPPSSSALATPGAPSDDDAFEAGSSSPIRGKRARLDEALDDAGENTRTSRTEPSATVQTQTTLKSFFLPPLKSKRPLKPAHTVESPSRVPRHNTEADGSSSDPTSSKPTRNLTQMHLTHLPLLHTCKECSMSYVRGGGEDESLHAKHHSMVVRGIPWEGLGRSGKGTKQLGGWNVIDENVEFRSGRQCGKGKVIMCDGSWGGARLLEICGMVDTVFSAPALPTPILDTCKIFLFITSSPPPSGKRLKSASTISNRERIVSVVIAQPIKVAMRVIRGDEAGTGGIDSGGGVVCDPTPLPTPLGIHRLFTVLSYRSLSLSRTLLDAACRHTIYGMHLDPSAGQVAFSQPTDSGRRVMEKWGGGGVKVFVDDERQL